MPRPSRLGLALAATVAVSSLTFGGAVALAVPGPGTEECTAATDKVATAQAAADADATDTAKKTALATAKQEATVACTAPATSNSSGGGTSGTENQNGSEDQTGGGTDLENQPDAGTQTPPDARPEENNDKRRGGPDRRGAGNGYSGVSDSVLNKNPRDVNCRDFRTQPSAQAYYDAYPGDPARLDRDRDGKACESLADLRGAKIAQVSDKDLDKTRDDESEVEGDQVSEVPEGSVDTGGYDR